MNCRGGKSCRGGGGIDRGPAAKKGKQRREREDGGRWQVRGWEVMVVTAVAGMKADGAGVAGGEPQAGAQRVTGRSSRSIEVARRGVCRLQRSWSNGVA